MEIVRRRWSRLFPGDLTRPPTHLCPTLKLPSRRDKTRGDSQLESGHEFFEMLKAQPALTQDHAGNAEILPQTTLGEKMQVTLE